MRQTQLVTYREDTGNERRGGSGGSDANAHAAGGGKRVSRRGYSLPHAALTPAERSKVKKELTMEPWAAGKRTGAVFRLWAESASRLYVPKCYGFRRFGVDGVEDSIPDGERIASDVMLTCDLRPEQLPAVRRFHEAATDPARRGGVLALPCGFGKTVIALSIVVQVRRKTIIIVHKDFLLRQWRERIAAFLPRARVGLIKAQITDVRDKDIVLASLQSLCTKDDYPPELFAAFGLLIIDEVHHMGAEVFSRALRKANVKLSLGLSATVKRKDGMTNVFLWHIGDVLFSVKTAKTRVDVYVHRYYANDPLYNEEPQTMTGELNSARMVNNLAAFYPRTRLVCDVAWAALEGSGFKRRMLILSDRVAHLKDIAQDLNARLERASSSSTSPTERCGMYVGGMKPADLQRSEHMRVILATYSFASEGFDVPGLDTLLLASPKSDITQSVGRILRQKEAERVNVPTVIDFVDDFSVFKRQAAKRIAYYGARGYRVTDAPAGAHGRAQPSSAGDEGESDSDSDGVGNYDDDDGTDDRDDLDEEGAGTASADRNRTRGKGGARDTTYRFREEQDD